MPGPGAKAKSKKSKSAKPSGPNRPIERPPAPFVGEIDNAAGWHIIVEIMCNVMDIPDLTTRRGLKKAHADFSNIYERLDDLYNAHPRNEKIIGGVVGIYAKMCADSKLRDKLFEKGIFAMQDSGFAALIAFKASSLD